MQLTIRLLREADGRPIGDIPELPGVTVYGSTPEEATLKAKALAPRVSAEEIEHGEMKPGDDMLQFSVAGFPEPEPTGSGISNGVSAAAYTGDES